MNISKLKYRYLLYNFIVILVFATLIYLYCRQSVKISCKKLENTKLIRFSVLDLGLTVKLSNVMTDLKIIANSLQVRTLLNNPTDQQAKQNVDKLFLLYAENSDFYDQFRYIDNKGQEICRVNYNYGKPFITPQNALQNKKDRYYFKNAVILNKGEIFMSPLDLNKEHGKIEIPHKPMIRFATPVFDQNGKKQGIVILNYLAGKMLYAFRNIAKNSYGEVLLLNSKGYILDGDNPDEAFAFMTDQGVKRPSSKINIAEVIGTKHFDHKGNIQYYDENGALISIKKLHIPDLLNLSGTSLTSFSGPDKWYIYSIVSPEQLEALNAKVKEFSFLSIAIISILSSLGFFLRYTVAKKNIMLMQENEAAAKKFAEQMKAQYDYLQYLLDALPFPFYVIDAKTYKIILSNKAVGDVKLNVSTCHEITHANSEPCNSPEHGCPLKLVTETKEPVQIEHLHKMPNGEDGYFLVHGVPIFNDNGELKQMIEFSINIDDRKKIEFALAEAKRQSDEANKAKSSFLATMSHEIRTPMNGVMGMSELLSDTELTDEQRDFVNTIQVSAESLLTIINDILDFSKIEANKLELEERPVYIPRLIESVYELLAPKAASKNIELLYILDNDVPTTIMADEVRLRQIIINLANNSLKFTDQGEILITVSKLDLDENIKDKKGVKLQFAVHDTGIGISEENIQKLFEAFSQEDSSTTRKYGGTGLGLAISKRLVDLMNGKIWVETEKGVGSTFFFTIVTKIGVTSVRDQSQFKIASFVNKKVLLVDDNATNRKIITLQIKSWGLEVIAVSSALEAEKLLIEDKNHFDLAILDYSMPEKNGIELAETLHAAGFSKDKLPMVLLSSVGDPALEKKDLFSKTLTKPLKYELLFNAIVELIGENAKESTSLSPGLSLTNIDFAKKYPANILLAEDNKINQKLALKIFEKLGYLNVRVAENGRQAIDITAQGDFDIIFMDMQMPEVDGIEATKEIRKTNKQIKIVAMSANAMEEDKKLCFDAGMDDYVCKPISINALKTVLKKYSST